MSLNPYAAPTSNLQDDSQQTIWQEGRCLVITRQTQLPNRCYICNQNAQHNKKTYRLVYTPPWVIISFLLLLFGFPLFIELVTRVFGDWLYGNRFAIVMLVFWLVVLALLFVKRKVKIPIGICRFHQAKRFKFKLASFLLFIASVSLLVFGFIQGEHRLLPIAVIGVIISLISALLISWLFDLKAKKITKELIWLTGVNADYRQQYPVLP